MTTQPQHPQRKYLHPEKYRECGLTVGLCSCIQENNGNPEKDCEYCYGTGVSVYTNIDLPAPSNCPHWIKDDIYVKGFRCSLYRDTRATHTSAGAQQRIDGDRNICKVLLELSRRINKYDLIEVQAIGFRVKVNEEIIKMMDEAIALLQAGRK